MSATRHENESLRDATLDDAAVIAEIYNEAIRAGNASMDDDEKTTDDILRQMKSFGPRETYILLEREEEGSPRVIGWGIIKKYSDRPGYRFCCETSVYLRFSEVGGGRGSRMKRALIERCREYGYHHLLARIFADNVVSIEYNRKLGYEMVGVQREIGYKNGRWQDVAVMQLILDDVQPESSPES